MRSQGWQVLDVEEGSYDVDSVVSALRLAKSYSGKPVFINIRTVIGVGTATAGTYKAHHGAVDADSITRSKIQAGLDPKSTHVVPPESLDFFRERRVHGIKLQQQWNSLLESYTQRYPEDASKLIARLTPNIDAGVKYLKNLDSAQFDGMATRDSNGVILEHLWNDVPSMCGGGADLVNSNKITYATDDVFLLEFGHKGRYLRNGIREHAMASIANGLAAYHPGVFRPITATFFMFYIYAAPGVRMGALSDLPVIHIATHDSFQEGQNGPTHQPLEVDSLFRAMPNLTYMRPCNAEELIGAWTLALQNNKQPTMLSVGRDPTGPVPNTDRNQVYRGAYVLYEPADYALTLVSCGTNLHYAVAAGESLTKQGIPARIVSAPSLDLFQLQDDGYKQKVFPRDRKPVVSVEEYVATDWARYVTASIGMTTYGYSASNASNYERFGLNAPGIERKVKSYLAYLKDSSLSAQDAGWRQL
ncbi:hypothetical protein ACHAQI_006428 [Fusarium lateritium]